MAAPPGGRVSRARRSRPTAAPTGQGAAPLLLTAGEGPWLWRVVRYSLLAGALDVHKTTFSQTAVSKLHGLGSVVSTAEGEWPRATYANAAQTFRFADGDDLTLELTQFAGDSRGDAGTGHQIWTSAIALAVFMRSSEAPELPSRPRVLELGAGIGLPGLDLARRLPGARVTMTDTRPALLSLMRDNLNTLERAGVGSSHVEIQQLTWGDEAVDGLDEADVGTYDLAVGADVCYDPASVPPLLRLVTTLRARVTILIGPSTRPSLGALGEALAKVEGVTVEERQLSLVSTDAEAAVGAAESVPATVHRMLIVRQSADPACAAADG